MSNAHATDLRPATSMQRWLLFSLAAATAIALALHGTIPQPLDYHAFADARGWLGLPNAANVL